jgi:hypothetical protein
MSKSRLSQSRLWTVALVRLAVVWLGQAVVYAELKVSPANVSAAKFPRVSGHWVGRITDSVKWFRNAGPAHSAKRSRYRGQFRCRVSQRFLGHCFVACVS